MICLQKSILSRCKSAKKTCETKQELLTESELFANLVAENKAEELTNLIVKIQELNTKLVAATTKLTALNKQAAEIGEMGAPADSIQEWTKKASIRYKNIEKRVAEINETLPNSAYTMPDQSIETLRNHPAFTQIPNADGWIEDVMLRLNVFESEEEPLASFDENNLAETDIDDMDPENKMEENEDKEYENEYFDRVAAEKML